MGTDKLKKPCKSCPFRRDSVPGALGGRNGPEVFVGQAHGPFYLPCHSDYKGRDPHEHTLEIQQCAGAAIYRANAGTYAPLPEALHVLPKSEEVFASAAEFMAHHNRLPIEYMERALRLVPLDMLLAIELSKQKARKLG